MNNFLKLAYEVGAQRAVDEHRREKTAFLGELYDDAVEATSRGIGSVADFYDSAVDSTSRGIGSLDRLMGSPLAGLADATPGVSTGNRGFAKHQREKQKNMMIAARQRLQGMARDPLSLSMDDAVAYARIRDNLVNNPIRGTNPASPSMVDRFATTNNPGEFYGFRTGPRPKWPESRRVNPNDRYVL